jgi:hypothetical protein
MELRAGHVLEAFLKMVGFNYFFAFLSSSEFERFQLCVMSSELFPRSLSLQSSLRGIERFDALPPNHVYLLVYSSENGSRLLSILTGLLGGLSKSILGSKIERTVPNDVTAAANRDKRYGCGIKLAAGTPNCLGINSSLPASRLGPAKKLTTLSNSAIPSTTLNVGTPPASRSGFRDSTLSSSSKQPSSTLPPPYPTQQHAMSSEKPTNSPASFPNSLPIRTPPSHGRENGSGVGQFRRDQTGSTDLGLKIVDGTAVVAPADRNKTNDQVYKSYSKSHIPNEDFTPTPMPPVTGIWGFGDVYRKKGTPTPAPAPAAPPVAFLEPAPAPAAVPVALSVEKSSRARKKSMPAPATPPVAYLDPEPAAAPVALSVEKSSRMEPLNRRPLACPSSPSDEVVYLGQRARSKSHIPNNESEPAPPVEGIMDLYSPPTTAYPAPAPVASGVGDYFCTENTNRGVSASSSNAFNPALPVAHTADNYAWYRSDFYPHVSGPNLTARAQFSNTNLSPYASAPSADNIPDRPRHIHRGQRAYPTGPAAPFSSKVPQQFVLGTSTTSSSNPNTYPVPPTDLISPYGSSSAYFPINKNLQAAAHGAKPVFRSPLPHEVVLSTPDLKPKSKVRLPPPVRYTYDPGPEDMPGSEAYYKSGAYKELKETRERSAAEKWDGDHGMEDSDDEEGGVRLGDGVYRQKMDARDKKFLARK